MKTFGLLIVAAMLAFAAAAHADTCSQQAVTRAATLALDADRSLSALPVFDGKETDVSAAGRKAIAAMKDHLNDYTVATMRCAMEKVAVRDLQKTLAGFAGVKLPEGRPIKKPASDEPSYGGALEFDVRALSSGAIGIVARFGIECGEDAMLQIFERRGDEWAETLRTTSEPYETVAGGWWAFDYAISPRDGKGNWFVATKNVAPWCSSTWSTLRYAVLRPGADAAHPRRIFAKEDGIWWATDRYGDLKVDANGFDLRWRAESMDAGVHNREWIARYAVDDDRVHRIAPIAQSPRDFADEWVRLDWADAKDWTAVAAYGLKPLHDRLHKSRNFDFVAIRRCTDADHTEIEVERTDSGTGHVYFQVSGSKVLLMSDVSSSHDPRCRGRNLFDMNKAQ
jgi:hypothetical protein